MLRKVYGVFMTDSINPNGYAVVYLGAFADYDYGAPRVCKPVRGGTVIDGTTYAIYDSAADALVEFKTWPNDRGEYGVLPVRMLIEERPRYVLKESAR